MDDERLPFLRTIAADRLSDGPRLVYADWLEERGECEAARFIRLQVEQSLHSHKHGAGRCRRCSLDSEVAEFGRVVLMESPLEHNHVLQGRVGDICKLCRWDNTVWKKGDPTLFFSESVFGMEPFRARVDCRYWRGAPQSIECSWDDWRALDLPDYVPILHVKLKSRPSAIGSCVFNHNRFVFRFEVGGEWVVIDDCWPLESKITIDRWHFVGRNYRGFVFSSEDFEAARVRRLEHEASMAWLNHKWPRLLFSLPPSRWWRFVGDAKPLATYAADNKMWKSTAARRLCIPLEFM